MTDRPYSEPLTAAYDLVASCGDDEGALHELAQEMLQVLLAHEQRSKPIDALARLSMARPDDEDVRHEARGLVAQRAGKGRGSWAIASRDGSRAICNHRLRPATRTAAARPTSIGAYRTARGGG